MSPQAFHVESSESSKSLSSKHDGESTSDPSQSHNTNVRSDGSTSNGSFVGGDTKIVNRTKLIVYISLLLASISIAVAAFFFVRNNEESVFEGEFLKLASEIIERSETNAENTVGQVRSLAVSISSYASTSEMEGAWPNVTLPHFEQRFQEAVTLTGSELFAFTPIVPMSQKASFEDYTAQEWPLHHEGKIPEEIHDVDGEGVAGKSQQEFYVPVWQVAPKPREHDILLLDMDTFPWFHQLERDVLEVNHAVMSGIVDVEYLLQATRETKTLEEYPRSIILQDVPQTITVENNSTVTKTGGFVFAVLPWERYFKNVLPADLHGFLVEVNDHCGTIVSYRIDGHEATVIGQGNMHSTKYDYLHMEASFAGFAQYDGVDTSVEHCYYTLDVYPTDELKDSYMTNDPFLFASAILGVFLFTAGIFFCYDMAVERRQKNIARIAKRTTDIVKSLFPKNVQERIMAEAREEAEKAEMAEKGLGKGAFRISMKDRLKETLSSSVTGDRDESALRNAPPIADLFPSTTIMFADLVGFTAWSSMREPAQVFQLLETIYSEFDKIAKKRRIFKVETVGDCYVAACGIPDPRRDHAVAMARFARDCLACMVSLMTDLEITLGPDTGELGLRVGLHSGPVTGGVLRGEKARFQLFGDTMNTTARIETTGMKNAIHLSEETANILQAFGKGHWTKLREDKVNAKGKGELTTYWLVKAEGPQSTTSGVSSSEGDEEDFENKGDTDAIFNNSVSEETSALTEKARRLVKWNTEVIGKILKEVIQRRRALNVVPDLKAVRLMEEATRVGHVFEEITEILAIPTFDAEAAARQEALAPVTLNANVTEQLEAYIHAIAMLYRDNAFHNFEHVSHVTMSVTKLFSRIVAPEVSGDERSLHDHTYGITSDPLTQFAAAFAGLIHDVDHQGVTNATLVEENSPIAAVYNNQSVAEQNSVDIAWSLLLDESFVDLRNCIYTTPAEYHHFRQLIVNLVMATDIMDKSLSRARKERWWKAFAEGSGTNTSLLEDAEQRINRKATIVLEHVIQASDVSHTMQHWHIYRKWNARLFEEMMTAYRQGRTQKNPADVWYEGEIGFFDFYIIPLAKKLKECGVFGVSSDEYLNYAEKNRKEWEAKGREVVAEMVAKLEPSAAPVEYQLLL